MISGKTVSAIVLAAGNSVRFGSGKNKNYALLGGQPVLAYSVCAFDENPLVDELLLVARAGEEPQAEELLAALKIHMPASIVTGGATRQQSVMHALQAAAGELVVIQDGARPLIQQRFINECLSELSEFRGVTVGVPTKDTVKVTDESGVVIMTTCRSNTWLIQTPQAFDRAVLLDCHRRFSGEDITDDCMLMERAGISVKVLPGEQSNLKITTADDLARAGLWLSGRQ